jgi:2,3-bisphosphoglycerate-independent phosphoglycerate mutase
MFAKKPTALVILDGFGYSSEKKFNAIAQSDMPHFESWLSQYPHALLKAAGSAVGLPEGFIGNSEVGHMAIGAGRVIEQPLTIIHKAISDGTFNSNAELNAKLAILKKSGKKLHIIGLLSDAGVHSHTEILYALIKIAIAQGVTNIVVHPILDGRDVPPESAIEYLEKLDTFLKQIGHGIIGSIQGRFYAMDRNNNWDRTQRTYNTLTQKQVSDIRNWQSIIEQNYAKNITDEFIEPTQLNAKGIIESGDGIIFFNIRPDRARQLAQAFVDPNFNKIPTFNLKLAFFITPVSYESPLITSDVLFEHPIIHNTLKEVLAHHDKSMLSIAESEKYAHITYFFAGGQERVFNHEFRILIPSQVSTTFTDCPEMSAAQITQSIFKSLKKSPKDFYLINYANADMVGHSGDFHATIKALEFLDTQLYELYERIVLGMHGTLYITADHGKAEEMFDIKTGLPRTAHTANPVPFLMIREDLKNSTMKLPLTELSDIAPFILEQMGIPVPDEMKK